MIVIKMMGGLGNQMFQVALACKLKHLQREVKVDTSYFASLNEAEMLQKDTPRDCALALFDLNLEEAEPAEIERLQNPQMSWSRKVLYKLTGRRREQKVYVENSHKYLPALLQIEDAYLMGYWQSEKYFKDIRSEICKCFAFAKIELTDKNAEMKEQMGVEESVSIHIRGGDYLQKQNQNLFGGICTRKYYEMAIDRIRNEVQNPSFYVFTNDIEWAQKVLPSDMNFQFITWNGEEKAYIDMILMSKCRHHIIANSSFSWWGAWLGRQEGITIAPMRWMHDTEVEDIDCEGWIRM